MKYVRLRNLWQVRRFVGELRARRRLQTETAMWSGLAPILKRSASVGCTFYELDVLYHHIVEHRPEWILELGSGISTIVMGYAANQVRAGGRQCTIVSLEQHESYFNDLGKLIPSEIAGSIELIHSPVEVFDIGNGEFIAGRYTKKPKHNYGLVFVDGPQNLQYRSDSKYLDGDLLDAIDWNADGFVAFLDGRAGTLANLRKLMPWAEFVRNLHHKFTRIAIPPAECRVGARPSFSLTPAAAASNGLTS
jgi:hypothetical protein